MTDQPTLLKVLLKQRHLQGHRSFCREYNKVAGEIDKELMGSYPSKAQFYRWLSGELIGLPYSDHCRILERMFPGHTAQALFEQANGNIGYLPEPTATTSTPAPVATAVPTPSKAAPGGIVAAYPSRSEFSHDLPPGQLFDGAESIRIMGLSLNLICQQYPSRELVAMLEAGTTVDCLFLDPDGEHILRREQEEDDHGTLVELTRINLRQLVKLRAKLSDEAAGNLCIRTYDAVVRFNITIVNGVTCVVQPYMPNARGVESPTLILDATAGEPGLFHTFAQVLDDTWAHATEVTA